MRMMLAAVAFAAALNVSASVGAEVYPSRPVTVVVPFPPGGPLDTVGRIVAEGARGALGQPFVIENIGGAAGILGVGRVARAANDGYTLSLGFIGTHVINGATYALPYDLLNDFEPISLIASNPWMIVAGKTVPARDLMSFIAWLRANPDKASQGTVGPGSPHHVAGLFFQKETGTRFRFVPYRGAAPAMQDLVAGHIDLIIDSPTVTMPQIRAGTIKGLAVAAPNRLAVAPDIPTVDEAGLPAFYVSSWSGLWAPKGTSTEIIAKLNAAIVASLADAAVRARVADVGMEIFPRDRQTPEALAAHQKAEIEKWWPIIKAANVRVE
jgi:tripartite-type tricarboxylate transporter receptor subunit TctC